jgi:PiT family inorganic phosphate transporter
MMFSVCLCSFIFIMSSSFFGMPISGTHTVIGALLGAGIIGTGYKNLNWNELGFIVLSWVISPILAALLSFILMTVVASLTMNTLDFSYKTRIWSLQLITATSIEIIAQILTKILGI